MSKGQNQNRKPISKKAEFVVPCAKYGSIEKIEKLQNVETVKGLYLSTVLTEQNRTFLEEQDNEGTVDDIVSLIKAVWDNYLVGELIVLVEQSTQVVQEIPRTNLHKNKPDKGSRNQNEISKGSNPFNYKDILLHRQREIIRKQKEQIFDEEQELFEKDEQIAQLENELEEVCEELFLEVNLL